MLTHISVSQPALKFTLKDRAPICYLRPVQSELGQCHFAYPLYRKANSGALLSFEDVTRRNLQSYAPVESHEYNLTEVSALTPPPTDPAHGSEV